MKKSKKIIYGYRYQSQSKRSVKFSQIIASEVPQQSFDFSNQNTNLKNQIMLLHKQLNQFQNIENQKLKIQRQLFAAKVKINDLQEVNFKYAEKIKEKQNKIQLIEQKFHDMRWQNEQLKKKVDLKQDLLKRLSKYSPLNQSSVLNILSNLQEQCVNLREQIFKLQNYPKQKFQIPQENSQDCFQSETIIKVNNDYQSEQNFYLRNNQAQEKTLYKRGSTQDFTNNSTNVITEYEHEDSQRQSLAKLPQRQNYEKGKFSQFHFPKNRQRDNNNMYNYENYINQKEQQRKVYSENKFQDFFDS